MKISSNFTFSRDVKAAVYAKDTSVGEVVILCKSKDKEALYHELIETILHSDTVLSYRYFGGVSVYVVIPQSVYECLPPSEVKVVLNTLYDNFSEVFNIQSIILVYTNSIGDLLFCRLVDTPVEGEEAIVNRT